MKVLILSCNTGGGHNAAASALKESLNFYHHEAEVLDLMSLGRKHTSALVGGAYVKLVSVFPAGFGALYQLGELVRKFPWKSPVYYANARLGNALADYIDQNHFNAVVTTHLYPAETLTWMKQKGRLTIPCVAVATDYACIPFWEETNCDYYVVPHKDLIPEFASCGIPEEKLLPLGIPVRPAFARPASKEDVRRHLGLPENAPLFLVMSGSMGFGKVHLLAHELVSRLENGEQLTKDENPFLGYRAIRFCLDRKDDVYRPQLRALLRASAYGNIKIMVPMVTCIEELREAKALIEEIKKELDEKNIPYKKDIEVGIMVETAAASLMADVFAKEAAFFSIGTNDLTQYTMSVDRGNDKVSYLYSTFNPAVLRSIKRIITCGREAGIMVGMCGEAASDPLMIPLLLAFGLNEFSMSASAILYSRKLITNYSIVTTKRML